MCGEFLAIRMSPFCTRRVLAGALLIFSILLVSIKPVSSETLSIPRIEILAFSEREDLGGAGFISATAPTLTDRDARRVLGTGYLPNHCLYLVQFQPDLFLQS